MYCASCNSNGTNFDNTDIEVQKDIEQLDDINNELDKIQLENDSLDLLLKEIEAI